MIASFVVLLIILLMSLIGLHFNWYTPTRFLHAVSHPVFPNSFPQDKPLVSCYHFVKCHWKNRLCPTEEYYVPSPPKGASNYLTATLERSGPKDNETWRGVIACAVTSRLTCPGVNSARFDGRVSLARAGFNGGVVRGRVTV